MKKPVYLDHNATTPVDPAVLDAMLPYFSTRFGNASSSSHVFGWTAGEAVDLAREQVAALIEAEPGEIVFTSGATESLNLAVKGVAAAYARKGRHVVTVPTAHRAVLDPCKALERQGAAVTYLPTGPDGLVDPARLADALTDETVLVAVLWANNETGVLQPVPEIAEIVRARGALLLVDATQAVGKIPVSVEHADLLACSAHKLYGPKGVGALYVSRRRPRVRLVPLLDGGGQEKGLRGGTLNTPGIVGLGAAAELAGRLLPDEGPRLAGLRDRFEQALLDALPGARVNGPAEHRLPHTTNLTLEGVPAGELMTAVRDVAFSAGSACSSASGRPSHVLKAMGLSDEAAFSSIRIGLGRSTTREEIDFAAGRLIETARRIRAERRPAPAGAS